MMSMISNFSVIPIHWILAVDSEMAFLLFDAASGGYACFLKFRAISVFRVKLTVEFAS